MKKIIPFLLSLVLITAVIFTGCFNTPIPLDPKNPVTITMWHNFGGDMQTIMDTLIDEFNNTVGKKQGIIINVTAISSSSELQEKLGMIVDHMPGAPRIPDIFTSYPKTAILLNEKGLLCDLDAYFTEEELSDYVPQFLDEGRLPDGGLYVFPFAKSTEILYLNQTLFDRFSSATGIGMDSFDTFEGIASAAMKYYEWTDAQTPDVKNDGKMFFTADSWLNLAQAGMLQQGDTLFKDEKLSLDGTAYKRIWDTCYAPSVGGGFAIYDGYSSDLSKTGDLICSTGSSAGILFYGDTVTYEDNTTENVKYTILPFPVFEGGKKIAIQRGNGLCVAKSSTQKEYAACVFLKWFTEPEQNMRFIESTGYMPVTNHAFENGVQELIKTSENQQIKEMLMVVSEMYKTYDFFTAPVFESFDSLSRDYEKDYKSLLRSDREKYLETDGDLSQLSQKSLAAFQDTH